VSGASKPNILGLDGLQRALLQWSQPKRGSRGNCGAVAPRRRPQRAARGSEAAVAAAPPLRLLDSQQRTMELGNANRLLKCQHAVIIRVKVARCSAPQLSRVRLNPSAAAASLAERLI
jgi:hypothetical protein